MRNLLSVMLAMAGTLFASDPPKALGALLSTDMVDATTVVSFYEHGVGMTTLDIDTLEMETSYAVEDVDAPTLTTTWTSGGINHTVTTQLPSQTPSAIQITRAMARHHRLVTAMQALYPPN